MKDGGPELAEGKARDQLRYQEQPEEGKSSSLRTSRGAPAPLLVVISTFKRFGGSGVKMPVNIAITTICGSLSKNVLPVTEKKETVLAARQPGGSLGSRESKPGRIGQDEEWSRMVPFPFFQTYQITTPLAIVGGAVPPLQSVKHKFKLPGQKAHLSVCIYLCLSDDKI